jgi:hypothetical protein
LLEWLEEHGGFVRGNQDTARLFYYWRDGPRLFDMSDDRWSAWLYALTGVNPASTDFAYLTAQCQAVATFAPRREIVKVAHWSDREQVLRVSRFDGTVYVLDGATIRTEANGEHVLFDDNPLWQAYEPDLDRSTGAALRWHVGELPSWDTDDDIEREGYILALMAWIIATLFTELCPTRPMLVLSAEKGSGKTMLLRLLLRYLFGLLVEVSGVPDKKDGFTAAAAAAHVLVLDNLDNFNGWLRDKLARLATGGMDDYRQLWTSNEVGHVRYRCWLAFTSRTPDTLRRDDLADRLLLLPLRRIESDEVQAERDFLRTADLFRGDWWGDLLHLANRVVDAIRRGELKSGARLRMADWESLGRLVARIEGKEETWNRFIDGLKGAQADFLLEGDILVDGLAVWMQDANNHGREVTARDLHTEIQALLFGGSKPPSDWPKSALSFGKRLAGIRRELRAFYNVEWGRGTEKANFNRKVYQFWPK